MRARKLRVFCFIFYRNRPLSFLINLRTQFHVIEQTRTLPIFSMYFKIDPIMVEEPRGFVSFSTSERISRVGIIDFELYESNIFVVNLIYFH